MSTYSFLGGMARLNFPDWNCKSWSWQIPLFDYEMSLHYPGTIFSALFYLGIGASAYYVGRSFMRFGQRTMTYFKSMGNASKYLNSKITDARGESYTAVIYGAGTKAGRIYAHYLAQKGFNLVLVEREQQSLNILQQSVKFDLSSEPLITTIVLDKFDMDTFNKTVVSKMKAHKNSPVKLFINCKNSRRKAATDGQHTNQHMMHLQDSMGQSLMLDESVLNDEERFTLRDLWSPAITREEIFFTGKENIEGFVSLLSFFLPQMVSKDVDHPAMINIDNQDCDTCEADEVKAGQLFFQSVVNFKDTFTANLPRHVRDRVHTITVKTDFNNLPAQGSREDVQNTLCHQAFSLINLEETMVARFPKQGDNDDKQSNSPVASKKQRD